MMEFCELNDLGLMIAMRSELLVQADRSASVVPVMISTRIVKPTRTIFKDDSSSLLELILIIRICPLLQSKKIWTFNLVLPNPSPALQIAYC